MKPSLLLISAIRSRRLRCSASEIGLGSPFNVAPICSNRCHHSRNRLTMFEPMLRVGNTTVLEPKQIRIPYAIVTCVDLQLAAKISRLPSPVHPLHEIG